MPCTISLERGSQAQIKKPGHQCKLVSEISYSLGSAAHSSLDAPCTNRPVQCQHCPRVVPSYSMAQHYRVSHSTTEMPAELAQAVALGKHERAHVMQLLSKRKVHDLCPGASCCPKNAARKRARVAPTAASAPSEAS